MAQLFTPRADVLLRTTVVAAAALGLVATVGLWAFARTPAATAQYSAPSQPVPFAHPLHVSGLHIDCRYCHAGAERSAMAGLPPTSACVPCHRDALFQSSLFAAVRTSLSTGRPIPWQRVTHVPGFVYFNHAVHVRNGLDCETCHGPIHLMQQVYQAAPLTMEWCLQCHRAPERYISPKSAAVAGWTRGDPSRGRMLAAQYDIQRLTSCTTCHR